MDTRIGMLILASMTAALAPVAAAQQTVIAPASAAVARGEVPGMWLALMVSDSKQALSNAVGISEVEARLRAKKDCAQDDCQLLLSMPLTPPACLGVAAVAAPRAGVRGVFAASAADVAGAGSDALAQCQAAGGRDCAVKTANCF